MRLMHCNQRAMPSLKRPSPAAVARTGDRDVSQSIHSAAQHMRLRLLPQSQVQDLGQQDAHKLLVTIAQHNNPCTQQQGGLHGSLESATQPFMSAELTPQHDQRSSPLSTMMADLKTWKMPQYTMWYI